MSKLIHIGHQNQPTECAGCPYPGHSFCPDSFPANAKFAILLDSPSGDDILYGRPLSGKRGDFFEYRLLSPLGLKRSDVAVSHVLRCKNAHGKFPTGKWRTGATEHCRCYDNIGGRERDTTGLKTFSPDILIITMDPWVLLTTPAPTLFIRAHMEKAMRFVARGRKPVVCMGTIPMNLLAPHLHGGVKKWCGHVEDFQLS